MNDSPSTSDDKKQRVIDVINHWVCNTNTNIYKA